MNRIILIGNGFDLAHELETRYRNFLQWFWNDIAQKIWGGENAFLQEISTDDLCIKINTPTDTDCPDAFKKHDFPFLPEKVNSLKNLEALIYQCKEEQVKICQRHNRNGKRNCRATLELHVLNKFLESISAFCDVENWVDIEQAYYLHLKKVVFNVPSKNPTLKDFPVSNPMLKDFHIQFERIKKLLETYLTGVSQKEIKENKDIQALFESSFQLCDIAISSQDAFLDELSKRFFMNMMEHEFQGIKEAYQGEYAFLDEKEADRAVMRDKLSKNELGSALSPDSILFLNFNYTNTLEKLYLEQTSALHIHIHGELNSEENPIIFGYGDEMDAKYKELEDMNDNTCLTNMKSINYLGTDKYRQLLMFMQQGLYQVFVMGHSCGNSDRTLLNTLFEHKNCISIKPFYHEQEPGKDNYNDMVKNISRCFKDAASMRDRVVNRNFCTTLPQSMTLKQD